MGEWIEAKLGDYVDSISETYKFEPNEQVIFLNTSDILLGRVINRELQYSANLPGQAKKRIKKGDILFSEIRPANGRYALVDFDASKYVVSTKLMVLRCREAIDNKYFEIFLTSKEQLEYLQMIAEDRSGTFPQITFDHIYHLNILVPPLPEQKAIANVLSSLDDKIDLLHRQNKTLETMAETLFRQWFIEEAQEDWGLVQLGRFVEVERGLSYKGAGLCIKGLGVPMHNLNSIYEGGGYKYEGIKYYSGDYKDHHVTKPGDIIIANTEQGHDLLLIGFPAIIPKFFGKVGIFSQHIYKLNIKDSYISNAYLYFLLMNYEVRDQVASATNGSTVNMLPKDGIEWVKFRLPPEQKIIKFTSIVEPYLEKQEFIHNQIQTLEKLRDNLLPKLMSGEIRVNYE